MIRPMMIGLALATVSLGACDEPEDETETSRAESSAAREEDTATTQYSNKFSPETIRLLTELSPDDDPTCALLMRIDGVMTPERRGEIEALGGAVRSVAGDIITLDFPARRLDDLADFDFTLYIEASRPLHQEGGEDVETTEDDQ